MADSSPKLFDLDSGSEASEFILAQRPAFIRGTLHLTLLLLGAAVAWGSVARVDVVVSAPGFVRPVGDLVPVQAPQSGVIAEIAPGVAEGARVASGDLLFRFDPGPLEVERRHVLEQLEGKRAARRDSEEVRRRLALSSEAERATRLTDLAQAKIELETERTRTAFAVAQGRARLATSAARRDLAATRVREEALKVGKVQRLVEAGVARPLELDDERSALANLKAALGPAEREVEEARIAAEPDDTTVKLAEGRVALRKRAVDELEAVVGLRDAEAAARLPAIEAEIAALERERERVELRIHRTELRAPVAGTITRLAFLHAGRVVPEGALVAEISPSTGLLVVEALVRDSDRGRPLVGKKARLRFAAFRYQDYGAIEGRVTSISPDAVELPGGARALEPTYKATIEFPNDATMDDRHGSRGRIELGMTAQADIVVEVRPLSVAVFGELRGLFGSDAPPN